MKLYSRLFIAAGLFMWLPVAAQKAIKVSSPDNAIAFTFRLQHGTAQYSVSLQGRTLIEPSSLSLVFDDGAFEKELRVAGIAYGDTTEDYELVTGKTKFVHEHYKTVAITLQETKQPLRTISFEVKVFNDGLAFRYVFPQQKNRQSFTLLDENTRFNIAGDPTVHALFHAGYTSSHEGFYSNTPLSKVTQDTLMDMPALFDFNGTAFLGITEAALLDYAGMYLSNHGNILTSKLSPLPGQTAIKVKSVLPHATPWRVLLLSSRVGALIESNIITTLNAPNKLNDISWLRPGKTTFPWWNGNVVPDTINAPGNNFVTNQYYIDFCARNNIDYHSVVEYGLHQWYMDDGVGFQPGPHSDVTTPVPGLDMKQVCDYAASKGVGIRVWVHWAALYPKIDSAFAIFEKWGLKGMMIDFMDRDDQQMVNMQTEMLEKAAAHHLHIQFHGAYKNTGLHRTYPNELTREGTLNYETDKWDDRGLSPDHDINIPFTRMLAGSTDYHLGGFRAVSQNQYRTQYTRPLVLGTRCHMLAMYVVLENYLQMVCDYPEAYEGQPGFDFIREIPTVWDETRVVAASLNNDITIARRKDKDWYVGTINNSQPRDTSISLSFLGEGNYKVKIYSDSVGDTDQNAILQYEKRVSSKDILPLKLAGGGGAAMHFTRE